MTGKRRTQERPPTRGEKTDGCLKKTLRRPLRKGRGGKGLIGDRGKSKDFLSMGGRSNRTWGRSQTAGRKGPLEERRKGESVSIVSGRQIVLCEKRGGEGSLVRRKRDHRRVQGGSGIIERQLGTGGPSTAKEEGPGSKKEKEPSLKARIPGGRKRGKAKNYEEEGKKASSRRGYCCLLPGAKGSDFEERRESGRCSKEERSPSRKKSQCVASQKKTIRIERRSLSDD